MKVLRIPLGFFLLFFLLASQCYAEKLSVATDEPYSETKAYSELKQFVREALAKAGFQVEYVNVPSNRASMMTSQGEADALIIASLGELKTYPNLRPISFPYGFSNIRFIYLKTTKSFDENNLKKYRGVGTQDIYNTTLQKEKLNLEVVKELEQGVRLLRSHRADYLLSHETTLPSLLKNFPNLEKEVKVSERVYLRIPLYFVVNQKKAFLLPRIEKAFRDALKNDASRFPGIKDSLNTKL